MTQTPAESPVRALRCPPQLFIDLREQSLAALQALLARTVDKAGDWLSGMQEKPALARTAAEAQAALRLGRSALERAYGEHFARAFDLLRLQVLPSGSGEGALRLMDESELERLLAAESLVDAVQAAHGPALETLSMRFAAMAGVKELRAACNPLAPLNLGNALQVALLECPLPAVLRSGLAKLYEQELVASIGVLLGELNARMAGAGILPQLGGQFVIAETGDPLDEAPLAPFVPENRPGIDVRETFNEIRGLLHRLRPAPPAVETAEDFGGLALPGGARELDAEEIVVALTRLQAEVPPTLMQVLGDQGADLVQGIKQEIAGSVPGLSRDAAVDFQQEHEDAIDLVGMLFDVLFDERDFTDRARLLMARLVLPYVKAAVLDLRLFQYTTHPARRLLNSLAEALEGNRGEGPAESALLDKADAVVEALVTGFDRDLLLFEVLGRDLRVFLVQHRQKQALAERRASELQRGQEALERARAKAAAELEQRQAAGALPAVLQEFLSGYWAHHLSIVALREGTESQTWRAALEAADRLLEVARRGEAGVTATVMAGLEPVLRRILLSSGQIDAAAAEILHKLAEGMLRVPAPTAQPATDAADALAAEPAAAMRSEVESANAVTLPELPGLETADTAPEANLEADLKALRALKVGDWIELVGDDHRLLPVKYAWISPISLRLMFTNRRGVRMLIASVEELAEMKRKGQLLLREHAQLFDHAINRVKDRLEAEVAKAA